MTDLEETPWGMLRQRAETARAHPDGIVDLSIGNPVDPVPLVVRRAIARAPDAHAYPGIEGTRSLREEIARWYARRRGVPGLSPEQILPTIGSKECIAHLPLALGIGPGDVVVIPRAAYPTYADGARLAGATVLASDDPGEWPRGTRLVWLNSPGNPEGRVLGHEALRAAVEAARSLGAVLAHDECYAEFGWDGVWSRTRVPSVLDPSVSGDDVTGLLSVYSLSKQSNLAGFRAAFTGGDAAIVRRLLEPRQRLGLWLPSPVEAAMIAVLRDDAHVVAQRERYRARRRRLLDAVRATGFRVDGSEAGLFLWVTEGRDAWESLDRLARLGILAMPGPMYGARLREHVRVSLTATDDQIEVVAARLAASV